MLIIAHRGASGLEAENTISSFIKAQGLGVDMIETDLRLAGDQIILSHPFWKKGDNETTLEDLLKISQLPLNLEVKEGDFEEILLNKIRNFSSDVLVSSKHPSILKKIRVLDENIKLGLVLGRANFFLLPFIFYFDRAIKLYSIHPKKFLAFKWIIGYFQKLNKKIFVWTVNDQKTFERMRALNVDGVFTDRPDLIHK